MPTERQLAVVATAATVAGALVLWARWRRRHTMGGVTDGAIRLATVADAEELGITWPSGGDLQRLCVLPGPHGQILAAASLLIEPKCLRGAGSVCHVCEVLPGAATASRIALLQALVNVALFERCYKAIIDAPPSESALLGECGFEPNSLTMMRLLQPRAASADASSSTYDCAPRTLGVRPAGGAMEYELRPLVEGHTAGSYLALLQQLSKAPPLSDQTFRRQISRFRSANGMHLVLVVIDPTQRPLAGDAPQLFGCATLLFERLPAAPLGDLVARLEDVVVDAAARGTGLGRRMIDSVASLAQERGAHAVTLNCSEANEAFYAKCGFVRATPGEACFARYLTDT